MVDVECEPDGDAAPGRIGERARDEARSRLLEVEVVEREIESAARAGDELSRVLGDLQGALTAVRECPNLDRQA